MGPKYATKLKRKATGAVGVCPACTPAPSTLGLSSAALIQPGGKRRSSTRFAVRVCVSPCVNAASLPKIPRFREYLCPPHSWPPHGVDGFLAFHDAPRNARLEAPPARGHRSRSSRALNQRAPCSRRCRSRPPRRHHLGGRRCGADGVVQRHHRHQQGVPGGRRLRRGRWVLRGRAVRLWPLQRALQANQGDQQPVSPDGRGRDGVLCGRRGDEERQVQGARLPRVTPAPFPSLSLSRAHPPIATQGEDGGFAINGGQGWSEVVFRNHQIDCNGNTAIAMGDYLFTNATTGDEGRVEYTFGYKKNDDGKMRIFLCAPPLPKAYVSAHLGSRPCSRLYLGCDLGLSQPAALHTGTTRPCRTSPLRRHPQPRSQLRRLCRCGPSRSPSKMLSFTTHASASAG